MNSYIARLQPARADVFSYLCRMDHQHVLLERMLDDGIEAILVKVACPLGLIPNKHPNMTIGQIYNSAILHMFYNRY